MKVVEQIFLCLPLHRIRSKNKLFGLYRMTPLSNGRIEMNSLSLPSSVLTFLRKARLSFAPIFRHAILRLQ